jgi:hypothetical protein
MTDTFWVEMTDVLLGGMTVVISSEVERSVLFISLLLHLPSCEGRDIRNHAACNLDVTLIVRMPACAQIVLIVMCKL